MSDAFKIRTAILDDVKKIYDLLTIYADKGELLPRPLSVLYDHLRNFAVCEDVTNNKVVGCCSLQFCWDSMAEIRSLAVHPDYHKKGLGSKMVNRAIDEAKEYKINHLWVLTYRPGFFERFGFAKIDRSELPLKIWKDCVLCVKFPDCDETAMMMDL